MARDDLSPVISAATGKRKTATKVSINTIV